MSREPLNTPAELPREYDRWNWGAFLLNWIWGIGNSTFIALLMFVPFVNFVMIFILGAKGSSWAWRNRYWRDLDHFRATQRKWAIAGFIVWAAMFLFAALLVFGIGQSMRSSEPYQMTMETVRESGEAMDRLGAPLDEAFWFAGGITINADGTGNASFSVPVTGSKAAGRVISKAVRIASEWDLRLVVVTIDGSDIPSVLVNKDNIPIPDASIDI